MTKQVKIASFDPASLRNLGWSMATYIDEGESPSTLQCSAGTYIAPKVEDAFRYMVLWPIFAFVDAFLEKFKPDLVIIEQTGGFKGSFISAQCAQCTGVILAACGKHQSMVRFVFPSSVKKKVSGSGRATKTQLRKSVQSLLKKIAGVDVKFDSEHAVDATANILAVLIEQETIEGSEDE